MPGFRSFLCSRLLLLKAAKKPVSKGAQGMLSAGSAWAGLRRTENGQGKGGSHTPTLRTSMEISPKAKWKWLLDYPPFGWIICTIASIHYWGEPGGVCAVLGVPEWPCGGADYSLCVEKEDIWLSFLFSLWFSGACSLACGWNPYWRACHCWWFFWKTWIQTEASLFISKAVQNPYLPLSLPAFPFGAWGSPPAQHSSSPLSHPHATWPHPPIPSHKKDRCQHSCRGPRVWAGKTMRRAENETERRNPRSGLWESWRIHPWN